MLEMETREGVRRLRFGDDYRVSPSPALVTDRRGAVEFLDAEASIPRAGALAAEIGCPSRRGCSTGAGSLPDAQTESCRSAFVPVPDMADMNLQPTKSLPKSPAWQLTQKGEETRAGECRQLPNLLRQAGRAARLHRDAAASTSTATRTSSAACATWAACKKVFGAEIDMDAFEAAERNRRLRRHQDDRRPAAPMPVPRRARLRGRRAGLRVRQQALLRLHRRGHGGHPRLRPPRLARLGHRRARASSPSRRRRFASRTSFGPGRAVGPRRLDQRRQALEARLGEEGAQAVAADLALAEVGVAVAVARRAASPSR